MNIDNYEKIELVFEEFSIILPKEMIEKFEINKVEQLIEAKYNPEDEYEVYIVINRILAEQMWKKEIKNNFNEISPIPNSIYLIGLNGKIIYTQFSECINSNSIYDINTYKNGEKLNTYSPVWSYTEFENKYQRIGITEEKVMIRIKE